MLYSVHANINKYLTFQKPPPAPVHTDNSRVKDIMS